MATKASTSNRGMKSKVKRLMTVNEAFDMLEEECDDYSRADVFLEPPSDNEMTDEDSGDEDGMDAEINNLSRRQLASGCSITISSRDQQKKLIDRHIEDSGSEDSVSDDDNENEISNNLTAEHYVKMKRKWKKADFTDTNTPEFDTVSWSADIDYTPEQFFELFFDQEVIDHICQMSMLYSQQKGKDGFSLTPQEVRMVIAIILISGYLAIPRRRMFWENREDSHNAAVSSAMPRNRFEEILQFMHFSDNDNLDERDKMAKIRPLMSMLNERFLLYWPPSKNISVDESMVPYYGRHSAKQFIRGKPIRFGYKVWCLNDPTGYLIQAEPYQGSGTTRIIPGLGMAGSVVMDLLSELERRPYHVFFDNLFTSLPLLNIIKENGMNATGTLRANRLEGCPIQSVETLKKSERGTSDHRLDTETNIIIVRWNDNSVVSVGSTVHGVNPVKMVRRWSKAQHREVFIRMPFVLDPYNRSMGGTDRMDQNIAKYRPQIRLKKWWWPLFLFSISTSVHNSWQLYRKSAANSTKPLDFLGFIREVAMAYISRYRCRDGDDLTRGRQRAVSSRIPEGTRFDGKDHFIINNPKGTQRRCACCGQKTTKMCSKCPECPLHERCMQTFHQR